VISHLFGFDVAIEGDSLAVAAPDTSSSGMFLFQQSEGSWNQTHMTPVTGMTNTAYQNRPLAMHQGIIAVGATNDTDRGTLSGAVWVIGEWRRKEHEKRER
jgi:hypothetical protein